ncbi:MAG: hypothetical protein WKG01_33655 [Kofleriaceae bacterium]
MKSRYVLALGLVAALAAPACVVRGSGSMSATSTPVVYTEPPADQQESIEVREGHVWVRGRWDWQNGQWTWIGGHWERERAGYAWQHGRWERRGSSWHWVDGRWYAGASGGGSIDTSTSPGGLGVTDGAGPRHDHHPVDQQPRPPRGDTSTAPGGVTVSGGTNLTPRPRYPTAPPPAPRTENFGPSRSGFIWVSGRWDWQNGSWAWVDGHWERARANASWIAGRWELQGNYYVWIEGRWGR